MSFSTSSDVVHRLLAFRLPTCYSTFCCPGLSRLDGHVDREVVEMFLQIAHANSRLEWSLTSRPLRVRVVVLAPLPKPPCISLLHFSMMLLVLPCRLADADHGLRRRCYFLAIPYPRPSSAFIAPCHGHTVGPTRDRHALGPTCDRHTVCATRDGHPLRPTRDSRIVGDSGSSAPRWRSRG